MSDELHEGLRVDARIHIPGAELSESFIRASGPGGQNVNKVATAVELRFDVRGSPSLAPPVRRRLERLAGRRLTKDGVIVIRADRFRTQELNRAEARERLAALIREAATPPKPRIATKPTKASRERRLKAKEVRGETKRARQKRISFD
ncbi:MAG: alternative ribosome rescue aminoacyl-tRNA hydrolase ArfB [Hyphomicrobiaceae bacterium]